MVRQRTGYPEEGALVIATVTKIQYHSVFCSLDEYSGKSGMIHISEIAPGRIRNITEYVREGKTVIAKVLRIDEQKGHIDLSLRRVTEAQRRMKSTELKQQQIVEKIIEQLAQDTGKPASALTETLERALLTEYSSLYEAFQDVVEGGFSLAKAGVEAGIAEPLESLVKERIKPREVSIKGAFTILHYAPDGVQRIRSAFAEVPERVTTYYQGAGKYAVEVHAPAYKEAEEMLKRFVDHVRTGLGEEAIVSFDRTDKR